MESFIDWLGRQINMMWNATTSLPMQLLLIAAAWLYFAMKGIELITNMIISALNQSDSIIAFMTGQPAPSAPGIISGILQITNTVMPLDELLHMAAAYITFVLIPIGAYRFFKSLWPAAAAGTNT
jgi:hypothetical protein